MDKYLVDLWRWKCGLAPLPEKKPPTLKELFDSQWSPQFEKLMRNRLAFGYFRYAPLTEQKKGMMDNIGSIEKRIKKFKKSGNDEYLVDIANICMVEFLLGNHPNKHFTSIDDGEHVQQKRKGK